MRLVVAYYFNCLLKCVQTVAYWGNNDGELLICDLFWRWLVDCIHTDLFVFEMAESDHHRDLKVAHCGIGDTGRHHIRVQRHVDCRVLNVKNLPSEVLILTKMFHIYIMFHYIQQFYSFAVIYIKLTVYSSSKSEEKKCMLPQRIFLFHKNGTEHEAWLHCLGKSFQLPEVRI